MNLVNLIRKVISYFSIQGEPTKEIEADCPKCGMMQPHQVIGDVYRCTICGHEQPGDKALTREETSW